MNAAGPLSVVVLAAGFGSRMKSDLPKVLHPLAGRPMLEHVLRAVRSLQPQRIVVVVGHGGQLVEETVAAPDVEFVVQAEQLGTAHAFLQAAAALEPLDGPVLVLSGDGALLTPDTLAALASEQGRHDGMTLLTCRVPDPAGLGRVVRDAAGLVQRIVEEKDATPAERDLDEVVVGSYVFDRSGFQLARQLDNDNAAAEFYITDLIDSYLRAGLQVRTSATPLAEYLGVNDRAQLAEAERTLRQRINRRWLLAGVTMQDPETTFIDDTVELVRDVTLAPGVILRGNCRVESGAYIGAFSVLTDAEVLADEEVPPHSVS